MSGVRVNIPALRPLLVQAVSGNPISTDDAWALIRGWDAFVEAVEAAQALTKHIRHPVDLNYVAVLKDEYEDVVHKLAVFEFDKAVT